MSLQLDRDRLFQLIGRKDYGLAGHILKQLKKCEELNGSEFLDMLVSELGQPDEVGYYKGLNAWQRFKRLGPNVYDKFKWATWKRAYSDASKIVCERNEFKTLGKSANEAIQDILQK